MENKPFKSISEQVNLLKARGLIIDDLPYAYNVLSHVNYYRLSGYSLTLRENDQFHSSVTLEQIMQVYNFDAELRVALLYLLEYIEIAFRTHVGYFHAEKYGPVGYMDKSSFVNESYYIQFTQEIFKLIQKNGKNEIFIKHHIEKYKGQFPIWVIVDLNKQTKQIFTYLPLEQSRVII